MTWLQTVVAQHAASDAAFIAAAVAFAAAAFYTRARPRLAALFLCGLAFVVGLALAAAEPFLHPWDERVHALVARHLLLHPAIPTLIERPIGMIGVDWMETHVWLHKPPLALWLMAAGRNAFGTSELALRVPAVLLHAGAVYACARLGPALFGDDRRGRAIGLWAAFLFAVNGEMVARTSGRLPSDHPDADLISLTAIAALVAVHVANRLRLGKHAFALAAAAGALCGAAVLTKSLPGLLALGLLAVLLPWQSRGRASAFGMAVAAAVCAAVALPWFAWTRHAFPLETAVEHRYLLRHLFEPLEGHEGSVFFHLARIPRFFGEACPVALVWFFASRRASRQSKTFLAIWAGVPYAIFSLAATKMAAYPLIATPAIELMIAAALLDAFESALPFATTPRKVATVVVGASLVVLPIRYCAERWKPFLRDRPGIEQSSQYRRLARALGPGPGLVTGIADRIAFMFYTDWTAQRGVATPEQVADARARGWPVVDASLPRVAPPQ